MGVSKRYFQLSSDILMEYSYSGITSFVNQAGDASSTILDLQKNPAAIVYSKYNNSNNFLFLNNFYLSNFVLPVNSSEAKFIHCTNRLGQEIWTKLNDITYSNINVTPNTSDIIYDHIRIHFTGKNYYNGYESLILRANIYDKIKNKVCLLSFNINKTMDLQINENPMLINQKLYTAYIDLEIPSVDGLINTKMDSETNLKNLLSPSYSIMDNTPIKFSLYGVKSSYDYNQFLCYNTELINVIDVPCTDGFDKLNIQIEEATDGDYFEIYPKMGDGSISFSDFIANLSDGQPNKYIIFHEIILREYYTIQNKVVESVTHREQYIVNAVYQDSGEINEIGLEKHILYRPIILHSGTLVRFVIEDQMKIINTLDNTTIVQMGTREFSEELGCNPKKYGKKLNKIYLGEIPVNVNVYSKKPDDDLDSVKITNSSSNVTIENHQHSIIGFIECANVGVSIEQIPREYIDE